jgi:hypothetical protein
MAPRNGKEILEFSHREKSAKVYGISLNLQVTPALQQEVAYLIYARIGSYM